MVPHEIIAWEIQHRSFEADEMYAGIGRCICSVSSLSTNGYPRISFQGKARSLPRLTYETLKGPLSPGHEIRHLCDTRVCFNIEHLSEGTRQENVDDKKTRGRTVFPPPRQGEKNAHAKLTDQHVRSIRHIYKSGFVSQSALAKIFGVCQPHIHHIVHNHTRQTVL